MAVREGKRLCNLHVIVASLFSVLTLCTLRSTSEKNADALEERRLLRPVEVTESSILNSHEEELSPEGHQPHGELPSALSSPLPGPSPLASAPVSTAVSAPECTVVQLSSSAEVEGSESELERQAAWAVGGSVVFVAAAALLFGLAFSCLKLLVVPDIYAGVACFVGTWILMFAVRRLSD